MAYGICSLRLLCENSYDVRMRKGEWLVLAADALAFFLIAFISGMALADSGNTNTIGHALAWIGIGVCVFIFVVDTLSWSIRDSILQSARIFRPRISRARRNSSDEVLKYLSIGNAAAFIRSTGLQIDHKRGNDQYLIETSNKEGFNTILTFCPLEAIYKLCPALRELAQPPNDIEFFEESFKENHVRWVYFGEMFADNEEYWNSIVYDCTVQGAPLPSSKRLAKMNTLDFIRMIEWKSKEIEKIPVSQWFEPVFKIIDESLNNNEKILIHCHAGKSRSATILILYLIKRKNMSPNDALELIRSKRDVAPKFMKKVENYASALAKEQVFEEVG